MNFGLPAEPESTEPFVALPTQEPESGVRALAAGAIVFLAIAIVRLRSSPLLNFEMFGPWRYWADGLEIADAGRVPAETLQWGSTWTPTVSKVVLNSYHAALSYAIGRAPLPAMGALLWLASTGLAAGLWALGRELGLRRLAPLLPLLTLVVLDDELHRNLDVYTAENVGRRVAVCARELGIPNLILPSENAAEAASPWMSRRECQGSGRRTSRW